MAPTRGPPHGRLPPWDLDSLTLAFNPSGLFAIQCALGLVMFGVALDLTVQDFVDLARKPKAPLVGLLCQFLLMPGVAFVLSGWLAPTPSAALGMLLVAACPGGNISNFLTQHARGTVSVSVGMTAVSTVAAVAMTPLNLALWGGLRPETAALLTAVSLSPADMAVSVGLLLGLPVLVGMSTRRWRPRWADRLQPPLQKLSLVLFAGIVFAAFGANAQHFMAAVPLVFVPVLVMNAAGLALGYTAGRLVGSPEADCRAMSIEVGIQNSGLGLVLIFSFFDGLGGMSVIAGWWGIWHILSGLTVASWWRSRPR